MGSVPLMYQGSKYAPEPMVTIPPEPGAAPSFLSAEIGAVNASTVVVTFDQAVAANENDFALGVTIKVNGVATSISGGIRQTNHAVIWYGIPVLWHGSGDAVTWEYNSGTGIIVAESGGAALGNVSAQAVTNNCEYAALLDLQADTLSLNDGDPVSTWADQSGLGHDFTQTGTARPTKQTGGGYPLVRFDGVNDAMIGGDFADNLASMTVMVLAETQNDTAQSANLICKITDTSTSAGWAFYYQGNKMILQDDGGNNWVVKQSTSYPTVPAFGKHLYEWYYTSFSPEDSHILLDGVDVTGLDASFGTLSNISTANPVRLGIEGDPLDTPYLKADAFSYMIFSPIPNATNRAALEARLAARYGITL